MSDATTILNQLGGRGRLSMMIGASSFYGTSEGVGLTFRFKNRKANYAKVTLNGKDLYDVEIFKATKFELKPVESAYDVYATDLVATFERLTGLFLHF